MRRRSDSAYLGLGSNLGDRLQHLRRCEGELRQRGVRRLRASSVYATRYIGPGPEQPEYLNAVLQVATELDPWELLAMSQEIERLHGRAAATHLQPRPLDVDLLFYGAMTCDTPRLTLPHPRLAQRRFVLEPLQELGVLDELPLPGLRKRLLTLRRTQDVNRIAAWESTKEAHGVRS